MKTNHLYVYGILLAANVAFAQDPAAVTNTTQAQTQQAAPAVQVVTTQETALSKILPEADHQVIVVNQIEPTNEMVKQPTTVVEAQPLTTSKADQIRKAREEAELATEQSIVERLEQARMDDEKRRAEALFGGGFKAIEKKEEPAPAPVVVAAPVVQQVAAPVQEAPKADLQSSVSADLKQIKLEEKAEVKTAEETSFFSISPGMVDYDMANVKSNGAIFLSAGKIFESKFSFEMELGISEQSVAESYWIYRNMTQYNLGVGTRFRPLSGRVQPNIGLLADYVYRNYSGPRDVEDGYQYQTTEEIDTDAFDVGAVIGLDVLLGKNLALGVDYRVMRNVYNKYRNADELNSPAYSQSEWSQGRLEETDYTAWNLSVKYMF